MEKSRFEKLTEEQLQTIKNERLASKTIESTNRAYQLLQEFFNEQKSAIFAEEENFETVTSLSQEQLNRLLKFFWSSYRNKDNTLPKLTTLRALKFGLKRKFIDNNIDIDNKITFSDSNSQYLSQLAVLKREGKSEIIHKSPINDEDMETLRHYFENCDKDPITCQDKVFFDIMYYFCRRGRQNLETLKKSSLLHLAF